MTQCAVVFAGGCVAALLGGLLFLIAAVKNLRVERDRRQDTDRRWNLFSDLQDHMMAKADPEAFAAIERKRATKRRAAEQAKRAEGDKGKVNVTWVD